jgi:hypothetical protein
LPAIAQEPSPVINFGREAIKEGRTAAHEKVEADWARTFRRAKFPYYWVGMNTMTGANEAWFVSFYDSFADIEKANKAEESALKSDNDMLDARDGELRNSSRSQILVYRKDLSYHPERAVLGKTRYFDVSVYQVKLGKSEQFRDGLKTYLSGMEKSGYPLPVLCYQVVAGGHAGTYHFVTPMESLAALDSSDEYNKKASEALGPDATSKLRQSTGEIFSSIETTYLKVNPNMSYLPASVESADPDFWRPKPAAAPKPAAPKPVTPKPGQ